ncbi:hypothetical protein K466DRAFT_574381 [Polyporus arcularius HHB13444]|uniref:Uncharacterized protein n=1 Tax=Polyporus arcularius HHB13444 TaxID=1314778 RepID=A0A5C3PQT1_9APHY|nr:hypothetical protein K466DRAFT_574381 [Polyporus arcularius HHB13444]
MRPPPVPVRPAQTKAAALPRIQKKWKWTGDLFIDVSRDRAERVCSVLLSDSTDPLPNGLRFSICLTGDSIRLSAFHDLASLPVFLLASTRVQQFAKVGPAEETDADALKQIGIYMKKNSLFCFGHLYMDNASVGLIFVFPTGHKAAADILRVPPALSSDTLLQVALVPWELTTKEFRANAWKMRSPTLERTLDPKFIPSLDSAGRQVVMQRRFYQALHILGFPKDIYDYMNFMPRQYCAWIGNADTTSTGAGYETSLLKLVLSACKAQDVGLKANLKIVFVHVGGLASLHHLTALAERRMKTPVRFMTYGSHPSVPRERWGMREIYPIGGIMTFTPTAVIQNHVLLYKLIRQVAEHPVWDCYVLPSVVAMVAKLTCQGRHPLRVYDEGEFVYEELLDLIEQGSLSLAQAPQVARDPLSPGDPSLVWTRWTLRLPTMNARQILEECLKLAADQFASTSEANLPQAIEEEIARDLWRLQNQPVIMDNYRRFTVVRTNNDKSLSHDMRGFECTTLANFKFGDDCFDGTTKPDARKAEKK